MLKMSIKHDMGELFLKYILLRLHAYNLYGE